MSFNRLALAVERTSTEIESLKKRIRDGSTVDSRGCWIWNASTKNGYGQMSVRNRNTYTHQLSYSVFVGPIPDGQSVLHKCDVRRCNNPEHFFLGTQIDNIRDMRSKGRGTSPPRHFGTQNFNVSLTDGQVVEIRALVANRVKQREIARRFGCSQSTVWRIAHQVVRAGAAE